METDEPKEAMNKIGTYPLNGKMVMEGHFPDDKDTYYLLGERWFPETCFEGDPSEGDWDVWEDNPAGWRIVPAGTQMESVFSYEGDGTKERPESKLEPILFGDAIQG